MKRYIKLYYTNMIDDPKIGQLSDKLWRRMVELCIVAKVYNSGNLPETQYIARRLQISEKELLADLTALQSVGLVICRNGGPIPKTSAECLNIDWDNVGWYIPGFGAMQALINPYGDEWQELRLDILDRDNYICQYCCAMASHVDHIIPRCQGGTNDPNNLVAACAHCNMSKGGRTPEQAGMELVSNVHAMV